LKKQVIRFNRNAEHADLADSRGFFIFAKSKNRYEPLLFHFSIAPTFRSGIKINH